MGVEDDQLIERIKITIERKVLIQGLLIGVFSFLLTAFLIYYLSDGIIMFGLCLVFGATLGFVGIYYLLVTRPMFQTSIKPCNEEDDEEVEYQSIMKIE